MIPSSNTNYQLQSFEMVGSDFTSQITLLRKLKNFELAKDAFDLEVEVCEGLYHLVKEYQNSNREKENKEYLNSLTTAGT